MSKKLTFEAYFPLGIDVHRHRAWIGAGFLLSFLYSLGFFLKLYSQYRALFMVFKGEKILTPGAFMPDYATLLGNGLAGFVILAICLPALGTYYYAYHHMGSKSIYLMRRLPDSFDLWRRSFAVPLAALMLALLCAFVLLLLYYWIYLKVTPPPCLLPGQWQMIWHLNFGGNL